MNIIIRDHRRPKLPGRCSLCGQELAPLDGGYFDCLFCDSIVGLMVAHPSWPSVRDVL